MKTKHKWTTYLNGAAAVSAMTLSMSAVAIEKPISPDQVKQKDVEQAEPKQEKKDVAWLGLGGAPISVSLAEHLGLSETGGLTLFHVVPDSVAEKAGLKTNDVITSFNGQPIGSQQELRAAILKQQPGDEVTLKYIHKGTPVEKKVALGKRPANQAVRVAPGINPMHMFKGLGAEVPEAERLQLQAEIAKQMDLMRKQLKDGGAMELNLKDLMQEAGNPKKGGFQMHASTSITMKDEQGSITMKKMNGKNHIVARDKAGKVVFEGPYDTEHDKAAVPDDVRERVDRFGFDAEGGNKGFRFKLMPNNGGAAAPEGAQ